MMSHVTVWRKEEKESGVHHPGFGLVRFSGPPSVSQVDAQESGRVSISGLGERENGGSPWFLMSVCSSDHENSMRNQNVLAGHLREKTSSFCLRHKGLLL